MEILEINDKLRELERGNRRLRTALALAVATLALGAAAVLKAQQQQSTSSIKELFDADQKDRQGTMSMSQEQMQKMSERDTERRRLAHQLLDSGALKTGEDFEDASVIFQHGDKPQDYMLAHVLAIAAVAKGDAGARWIAAATLDRYLQSLKQPQVFGTQYDFTHPETGKQTVTQEPYDKNMLSDALRREFCVTSYAGQQKNVAALNQGKDFPSPDGCP